jgi:hypothetical protein
MKINQLTPPADQNVPAPLQEISKELQREATLCETIAEDKTQESLTGASCEKQMNEQAAREWRLKSKVWQEAEAIVRSGTTGPVPPVA